MAWRAMRFQMQARLKASCHHLPHSMSRCMGVSCHPAFEIISGEPSGELVCERVNESDGLSNSKLGGCGAPTWKLTLTVSGEGMAATGVIVTVAV